MKIIFSTKYNISKSKSGTKNNYKYIDKTWCYLSKSLLKYILNILIKSRYGYSDFKMKIFRLQNQDIWF